MKNIVRFVIPLFLFVSILGCDEVYDYNLKDTTWHIDPIVWSVDNTSIYTGYYDDWDLADIKPVPEYITFYKDGTTSWGGTWEKTDELEVRWTCTFMSFDNREYTVIYEALFSYDLLKLNGRSYTKRLKGSFNASKINK